MPDFDIDAALIEDDPDKGRCWHAVFFIELNPAVLNEAGLTDMCVRLNRIDIASEEPPIRYALRDADWHNDEAQGLRIALTVTITSETLVDADTAENMASALLSVVRIDDLTPEQRHAWQWTECFACERDDDA